MTYVYLPLMVLPLFAAIDRFDMQLLEAGYDLYAAAGRCCAGSSCRSCDRASWRGRSWCSCPSLGAYVTPRLLGGGKNMMIGNFIELQFGAGPELAARRGAVDDPAGDRDDRAAVLCPRRHRRGHRMADRGFSVSRLPGFTTTAILVFIALYLPIMMLVSQFVQRRQDRRCHWEGFSLQWYAKAWQNDQVKDADTAGSLYHRRCRRRHLDHRGHDGRAWHDAAAGVQGADLRLCDDQPAADGARDRDRRGPADLLCLDQGGDGLPGHGLSDRSPTRPSASPSPICRSAPGWKGWT